MKKIHPRHFRVRDHFMSWAGVLTSLIVLLIINAAYITNRIYHDSTQPAPRVIANSNLVLTSLQADETKNYTVKVSNVTESSAFDPAFTIDTTDTMLIMDISITNHTAGKQDLTPTTQLYVRDREGDTFVMHPSIAIKNPLAAASVLPGQTVTGQISFAVPKRLAHPLLYVDFGWTNQAPTVIDVLR